MARVSYEGISSDGDRAPMTEQRRSSLERHLSSERRPYASDGQRVSFTERRGGTAEGLPRGRATSLASVAYEPRYSERRGSLASVANEPRYSGRRENVEGLINQFSEFANVFNDTHEVDFSSLQQAIEELEGYIRDTIGEEVCQRQEGDRRLEKRCDALEKALSSLQRKHGTDDSDKQRIDSLEEKFGAWMDSQAHRIDSFESKLESLCKAQEIFSQELANFSSAHEQHLEMEKGLDTAVKGLTSAAEQTAKALAAAKAKLELVQEDMRTCEQHCNAEKSKHAAAVDRLRQVEGKTSALGVQLSEVERKLGSVGDLSRDVGHLKNEHEDLALQVKHKIPNRSDPSRGHGSPLTTNRVQDERQRWPQDINQLRLHVDNSRGDLAENPAWEHRAMHNNLDPLGANRNSRPYLAEVTFHHHAHF